MVWSWRSLLVLLVLFSVSIKVVSASEEVLTNETIIRMVQAGIGSTIIETKIKSSKTNFDLTTDGLLALKKANVPDLIILLMMESKPSSPVSPAPAPKPTPPAAPAPKPAAPPAKPAAPPPPVPPPPVPQQEAVPKPPSVVAGVKLNPIRDLYSDDYDSMLYGVEKNSAVGFSTAAGDVNGDGLDDLIVGALYSDASFTKKIDDAGATYVYFGRKDFSKTVNLNTSADLIIYGATKNENSGFAVAVGDVNGDGMKDIIVGAPLADSALSGKHNDSGVTYVVFGKKQFPQKQIGLENGMADVELHSVNNGEYSGSALAVGDFNGDRVDDVLIGSPFTDAPMNDAGIVYLVCGAKNLSGKYNLNLQSTAKIHGTNRGDRLGLALAAGDLNGDGLDDMVLGALETDQAGGGVRNVGEVNVIAGRKEFPSELNMQSDAIFHFRGSYQDDFVGTAVATGNVNGDGFKDLLIGVPYADLAAADAGSKQGDAGKVFVFYGRKDFGGNKALNDGADLVVSGSQGGTNFGDHLGGTIASADLNGDGSAEMIMGAPLADVLSISGVFMVDRTRTDSDQMKDIGVVFVQYGGKDLPKTFDMGKGSSQMIFGAYKNDFFAGVSLTKQRASDSLFGGLTPGSYRKAWMSKQYDRFFSKSLAAGDVNGDGIADLLIGAPAADGPRGLQQQIDDAGAVYLFLSHP